MNGLRGRGWGLRAGAEESWEVPLRGGSCANQEAVSNAGHTVFGLRNGVEELRVRF